MRNSFRLALPAAALCSFFGSPALAAEDVQGFWAGGYVNGMGGSIGFELTSLGTVGEIKYNATNWGQLGYAICEYVFGEHDGTAPVTAVRNTGAGTGNCLESFEFTPVRVSQEVLNLQFAGPEFELDAAELGGILTPASDEMRPKIPGFDVLGVSPGMTLAAMETELAGKGFTVLPERGSVGAYQGYTIDQVAWGRSPGADGRPTDLIFATFTARKEWAPDAEPVATYVGRDWTVSPDDAISGTTMTQGLVQKYGPRSNSITEARYFDQSGAVLQDAYGCPSGSHQAVPLDYQLGITVGREEIAPTCSGIVEASVSTDYSTGRVRQVQIRLIDPLPLRNDFWEVWSHGQSERLSLLYESVTGATAAAPEL